jgi:hypothetical protein
MTFDATTRLPYYGHPKFIEAFGSAIVSMAAPEVKNKLSFTFKPSTADLQVITAGGDTCLVCLEPKRPQAHDNPQFCARCSAAWDLLYDDREAGFGPMAFIVTDEAISHLEPLRRYLGLT